MRGGRRHFSSQVLQRDVVQYRGRQRPLELGVLVLQCRQPPRRPQDLQTRPPSAAKRRYRAQFVKRWTVSPGHVDLGAMLALARRLASVILFAPQAPADAPEVNDAPSVHAHASTAVRNFADAPDPIRRSAVTGMRRPLPPTSWGSGAFSGATSSGREVGASGSEPDLAILLLGSWHAGIIGAGPHNDLCSSPSDERRQMKVTFHRDGNYERSIEPTAGKWRAAGPLLVVQFQSEQGRWHDGDGKPGASKHVVEVVSRDQVLIRPVGGLGATEQYRRCASDR